MNVLLWPSQWRFRFEGSALIASLTANFNGGTLYRHWTRLL